MDELRKFHHIHFIGIGGIGMSAIAEVLLDKGFRVSGSDMKSTSITRRLDAKGARIMKGHSPANVIGADLVVHTSAVRGGHPEYVAAQALEKPIWRRARVLGEIMRERRGVAVCGTHGKTTTTSMIALALVEGGLDPTAVIGGELRQFGSNARTGAGDWTVAEADESDGSLLDLSPDRIVLTNVEADHMDYYRDLDHIRETFALFLGRLRAGGRLIACMDDPGVRDLLNREGVRAVTYGLDHPNADFTATDIRYNNETGEQSYTAMLRGRALGVVRLRVPGRQNVANSLATVALALDLGCTFHSAATALHGFTGSGRRFQVRGSAHDVTVIDDYAHHPTEIRATLAAARTVIEGRGTGRIIGVFQPHRYTRTAGFAEAFGGAFTDADQAIFTDVYAAGEAPIPGVSGAMIFDQALEQGHPAPHYVPHLADIPELLRAIVRPGDMVLTMGAGDITTLGDIVLNDLRSLPALPDPVVESDSDAEAA